MEQGVIVIVPDTMAAEDEGNRTHFIFLHLPSRRLSTGSSHDTFVTQC